MRRMHCYNCVHAHTVYDRDGLITGVECSRDRIVFLPASWIARQGGCAEWEGRE